jgi:hypothetical protein
VSEQSEIAEERELSDEERALVSWLLEHGTPLARQYLAQVPLVRVVSRCGCGCASLNFEVDGRGWRSRSGMDILSDHGWKDDSGRRFGIFLFAKANALAGVDVFSSDGLGVPKVLPRPGQIDVETS